MSEARVYNTAARPRMIIRGFADRPELRVRIAALAPTSQCVDSLKEVNQAEWDVLVTDSRVDEAVPSSLSQRRIRAADHLHVVFSSKSPSFDVAEDLGSTVGTVNRRSNHIRKELRRCTDVPARVQALIDAFEPVLRARSDHEYFELDLSKAARSTVPSSAPIASASMTASHFKPSLTSFAETADGRILAGRYTRSDSAEGWLIPHDVPDLAAWVAAALGEWHSRDAVRFPGTPDWTRQPTWATQAERQLLDRLDAIRTEREAVLAQLADRERATKKELESARQSADGYERALLTRKDDPLVPPVAAALRELGFTVIDADSDPAETEKLEDLRVTDPELPGWIALVEVKGYTKGAQTSALTQFIRFTQRYKQRTGSDPDALWYVANQFKDRDPASRQRILQSNEADVAVFADSGGLVIDTVELFRMLDATRTGKLTRPEARESLRQARGRYVLAATVSLSGDTDPPTAEQ